MSGILGAATSFRTIFAVLLFLVFFPSSSELAASQQLSMTDKPFQWGGEFKLLGSATWPGKETLLQPEGDKTFFDGLLEARLKARFVPADWLDFEWHHVIGGAGGDSRKATYNTVALDKFSILGTPPTDDRQLLDLSWTPAKDEDFVFYHRVDRLALTLKNNRGLLRLGRQAVTWGNGLIFNPMDLINPFSPIDVIREYKVGQDMAFAQVLFGQNADLQILYAPRRNPATDKVEWEESTFSGKFHFTVGKMELNIMAAEHFDEQMVGAGATGYLGAAVWRFDLVWTNPRYGASQDYLSAVANVDYSWRWWNKNWYGFLEVFYNGMGDEDYSSAFGEPEVQKKWDEDRLFTLGKWYISGGLRTEIHPLFNTYLTIISNVADPSFIFQPRFRWDFARNFSLTAWGNIAVGEKETEYGGFTMPGTNLEYQISNGVAAWLSYYF